MTLRLHEPTVRQLYKWWRQGAISMYAAGKCLGCEPRTVMRRWAEWDVHCREVISRRETAAVLARQRRAEESTRLWTNALVVNDRRSGYGERASEAFAAPAPALTTTHLQGGGDG